VPIKVEIIEKDPKQKEGIKEHLGRLGGGERGKR